MANYKMKTNKAGAKRFKLRASGKIKRKKAYMRHGMRKRTAATKRGLRQMGHVSERDAVIVMALLPNG